MKTPHSVISAPYHRLSKQILQTFQTFRLDPALAETAVLGLGVSYIVVCKGVPADNYTASEASSSLAAALLAGHSPSWLTPVEGLGDKLLVYRTKLAPQS